MNGHGVHEKTLAELKSGFAYDQIPTPDWQANTAWQKLNLNVPLGLTPCAFLVSKLSAIPCWASDP
jgi:hypothetical protein